MEIEVEGFRYRQTLMRNKECSLPRPGILFRLFPSFSFFNLLYSLSSIIDNTSCKRRLQLSSSHRNPSVTQLLVKTVLQGLPQDQWCNYCLDLEQLIPAFFSGHHFQSLEAIAVRGSCRLRRICTLRDLPLSTGDLPQFCQQLPSVPAIPLVVREAMLQRSTMLFLFLALPCFLQIMDHNSLDLPFSAEGLFALSLL